MYINRLRSPSGVGFFYHRLGSMHSPAYGQPIDKYELVATDASMWIDLFFAMYHPRRSLRVPEGVSRSPWGRMSAEIRVLCKLDVHGVHELLPDFPFTLPDAVEASDQLRELSPGLGRTFAREIHHLLNERPRAAWMREA